jgi:curved DNA-binding protein CbpA
VDTFELLPTLAQGELSETSAPELVAAAFRSRASGTLWVETPEGELRVYFRAGDMCGVAPAAAFHTLAHVLLANDWVSALEIDSTREESAAARKRHGEVLVAKGLLTPEQLRAALRAQHSSNLSTLLAVTAGAYDWRGWEPPPAWAREMADPGMCLLTALSSEKHAARRKRVIDWLGQNAARLSSDWPDLHQRIAFEPAEQRAASLLNVPRQLAEFVQASRLPQERAEALLVTLLLVGGAEALAWATPSAAAPEVPEGALTENDLLDLVLESVPDEAALPAETGPAQAGDFATDLHPPEQELLPALELDTSPRTPAAGPHDPGGLDVLMPDDAAADEPPLEIDTSARDVRKKLLARGLRNLGGGPRPAGGEGFEEPLLPGTPPPAAVKKITDDERRLIQDVTDRLQRAPEQSAYARLGVSPNASQDAIKAAYLSAAKLFHPDRASGGLASIHGDLQQLFGLLKEAYENISVKEARDRYDQGQRTGTGVQSNGPRRPSPKEEAAVSVKMGEVLLKKRDFEGAIAKLRRAVDLDASGDALAALAWALVADPKATAPTKEEAATLINKALRAEGTTARTFYVAGVLWRTKDPDSAVDAFRKALELDPHHSDAALELRLIEQRRGKQQKVGGGVLSGLLFGKRKG